MTINPPLLLACVLFLAACGGSDDNVRDAVGDYNQEKENNEKEEPEIPPIDCGHLPDLSDAVVTGIRVSQQSQAIFAADDLRPERHRLSIWFAPTYTQPAQARIGSWLKQHVSLFPKAAASSCAQPVLPERVIAVSLISDSDFHPNYPAGSELTGLFNAKAEFGDDGRTIVDGEAGLWDFVTDALPTVSLQHRFTVTVTLDSGAEHSLTLEPIVFPEALPSQSEYPSEPVPWSGANSSYLNDTGVRVCVDETEGADDCSVAYPLQDADVGRDVLAQDGALTKVGAGPAGFDFTKLDAEGGALANDAEQWSCVRDNHTGRVWEVKAASGLRDNDHSYTWYQPDDSRNGGDAGAPGSDQCGGSLCDTYHYVEAVNELGLCGIDEWRLPSRGDWLSLAHYGEPRQPLDPDYFPHTTTHAAWSASPFALYPGSVWGFSYNTGGTPTFYTDEANISVRLVAGGPVLPDSANSTDHCSRAGLKANTPTEDFELLENGDVARHLTTNLEWQRCSVGQQWDGSECIGFARVYTWQQALNLVRDMPGWRLPNIRELTSLQESCSVHPAINETVFPNTPFNEHWFGLNYWSSTPRVDSPRWIRTADFDTGGMGSDSRYDNGLGRLARVRLVRDGDTEKE